MGYTGHSMEHTKHIRLGTAIAAVAIMGAIVAPAQASAQLVKETTGTTGRTLSYNWTLDNRQIFTLPIPETGYQTTVDLPFLFRVSFGHSAFVGTETIGTLDPAQPEMHEVWGWQFQAKLHLGKNGFANIKWGPVVDSFNVDRARVTFPVMIGGGIEF